MKINQVKPLVETSLSRIYRMTQQHDSGMITAFRSARECGSGEPITKRENLQRNKSLSAKLKANGYGYTVVKGSYIENYGSPNAKEVGEQSFLVVDYSDKGNLKRTLMQLGNLFEQDSILFIPAGATKGELIGTSECPDAYPPKGQIEHLGSPLFGHSGEFMTRVRGRPFVLKALPESVSFVTPPATINGKWGNKILSEKNWKDIEI